MTAYYNKIDVAHVETGIRTFDILAPYLEEVNGRLILVLAAIHFAPTNHARDKLYLEEAAKEKVYVTGNTGIDGLMLMLAFLLGGRIYPLTRRSLMRRRKRLLKVFKACPLI